jgi:hypothetical protein
MPNWNDNEYENIMDKTLMEKWTENTTVNEIIKLIRQQHKRSKVSIQPNVVVKW